MNIRHVSPWNDIHLVPLADGSGFRLMDTLRAQYQVDGKDWFLTVPVGFVTDLASIPAIFRGLFKTWGWWTRAAIFHDVLYWAGAGTKYDADNLFEAILRIDEPRPQEEGHEGDLDAMVTAVRIGGRGNFSDPPVEESRVLSRRGYSHDAGRIYRDHDTTG